MAAGKDSDCPIMLLHFHNEKLLIENISPLQISHSPEDSGPLGKLTLEGSYCSNTVHTPHLNLGKLLSLFKPLSPHL